MFPTQPSRIQSAAGSSAPTITSKSELKHPKDSHQGSVRQHLLAKGMIVENSDDFIDVSDDFEVVDISNKMVHEQCMGNIKLIGDIFDEDDIS